MQLYTYGIILLTCSTLWPMRTCLLLNSSIFATMSASLHFRDDRSAEITWWNLNQLKLISLCNIHLIMKMLLNVKTIITTIIEIQNQTKIQASHRFSICASESVGPDILIVGGVQRSRRLERGEAFGDRDCRSLPVPKCDGRCLQSDKNRLTTSVWM